MDYKDAVLKVKKEHISRNLFFPLESLFTCTYPAGLECSFHKMYYAHVSLILKGKMLFQEENRPEYECAPGTALVIPLNCTYSWRVAEDSIVLSCLHHGLSFKDHGELALLFGSHFRSIITAYLPYDYTQGLIDRLHKSRAMRYPNTHISAITFDFLAQVLEHSNTPFINSSSNLSEVILNSVCYIEQNANRNITIKELADKAYLSNSRFAHLFKQEMGISPLQYIADRKTAKAKIALKSTNLPLSAIAGNLGFETLNYFSRFIKKQTGQTASEIRNSRNVLTKNNFMQ